MKQIFLIFGLIFLVSSCVKNNPDPAWIQINPWQLEANPNATVSAGELTHNITDAWVYIDNEFIGVFEVPCKIPVLYSGVKTIRVYPAIINNGISASKKIYPFMEDAEFTENLVQNETCILDPVTRYRATTEFWIEDFENVGTKIENDPTSEALISSVIAAGSGIEMPMNGNSFGRVSLNTTDDTWLAYSKGSGDELELPRGQEVYLEIDYHNTNRVTTGLLAVSPTNTVDNPNIQMNPQDDADVTWKKIYIELKEIIGGSESNSQFRLSFRALLDEEESAGEINIDNIKVVY